MEQVLDAEVQAQAPRYQSVLGRGQTLLSTQTQIHQQAVQKWIRTLKKQWSHLTAEVTRRRDRLQAAAVIKQVKARPKRHRVAAVHQNPRISVCPVFCRCGRSQFVAGGQETAADQRGSWEG